jgi:hypothetical protein
MLVFGLASMHPPTAACFVIILIPYILLNLKDNFRHSVGISLSMVIPFAALFPLIYRMALPTVKSLLEPQHLSPYVDLPQMVPTFGYLPVLFCLLGTFYLAWKRGRECYGLVLGLLALLLVLAIFFTFHYGPAIVYYRGLQTMMLLTSIVGGAGLMAIQDLSLPAKLKTWLRIPLPTQHTGRIACIILIGLTLAIAIPVRQNTPYYHMIDQTDYESFVWIKDNLGSVYDKAVLDPWEGIAFVAVTGKKVFSYIGEAPGAFDIQAYQFLNDGCIDTDFLRRNSITIVYTRGECHNPDLRQVREYIYLLKEVPSGD